MSEFKKSIKKSRTYYKFLRERDGKIISEHGTQSWEIRKEYSVTGKIVKCQNGFHASEEPLQALSYVKGEILALVTVSGDCDNDKDKVCYRSMTIEKAYRWTKINSVTFAIYAAEQVIKIYEDRHPNDQRPRKAIEAAKAYLKDPNKKAAAADAADAAAAAAYAAAAYAAAYAAADAADAAAAAAAYAAAAYAAAAAAADAAYAAAAAAYAAAARKELTEKLNRKLKAMIKKCELWK